MQESNRTGQWESRFDTHEGELFIAMNFLVSTCTAIFSSGIFYSLVARRGRAGVAAPSLHPQPVPHALQGCEGAPGMLRLAPYMDWLIVGGLPVFLTQCVPLLAVDLWAHLIYGS